MGLRNCVRCTGAAEAEVEVEGRLLEAVVLCVVEVEAVEVAEAAEVASVAPMRDIVPGPGDLRADFR